MRHNRSDRNLLSMRNLLLAAAVAGGQFGWVAPATAQSWNQTIAPFQSWTGVASSANGATLVAVADDNPGPIYFSTDSGSNWTQATRWILHEWTAVAVSAGRHQNGGCRRRISDRANLRLNRFRQHLATNDRDRERLRDRVFLGRRLQTHGGVAGSIPPDRFTLQPIPAPIGIRPMYSAKNAPGWLLPRTAPSWWQWPRHLGSVRFIIPPIREESGTWPMRQKVVGWPWLRRPWAIRWQRRDSKLSTLRRDYGRDWFPSGAPPQEWTGYRIFRGRARHWWPRPATTTFTYPRIRAAHGPT